jgi:hypothetical protein
MCHARRLINVLMAASAAVLFAGASPVARGDVACATDADCDDNNDCTDDVCLPWDHTCDHTNNTLACDDGDACTENDTCSGGVCAGTAITCDDGIACTVDSCVGGACQYDASACECDEDFDCDDGNVCTNDWCDPAVKECFYTNNTDSCDDGDACTENDTCSGGVCAGTAIDCDDGITCTVDSCVNGACSHDESGCECLENSECDDGNVCTNDVCLPWDNTCDHINNALPCDDGNSCTINDTCSGGTCSGTNICFILVPLCPPAGGLTLLMTGVALLAVRLGARPYRAFRRRTSKKR